MLVKQILPEKDPDTYRILGELTIKGVTQPIEFKATIKKNCNTIIAVASTTISRKKWNINYQPPPPLWNFVARAQDKLVDDDIPVNLELVFIKKQL